MRLKTPLALALGLAFGLSAFGRYAVFKHELYLRGLIGYGPGPVPEVPVGLDQEHPAHPGMPLRQALLLGWTSTLKHVNSSSYLRHEPKKATGRIRIGIFGDSHVEGAEVAKDVDFPTLLQKRFREAGDRRVEIINFGVGGYGFSQSFLMWEYFAARYELDRSIFVLGGHYLERDDTFTFQDDNFSSIHARYILRDGKPALMAPIGDSPQAISLTYHGLAPVWRYLRYDARLPVQVRMLLPSSSSLRFNPFYYALAPFAGAQRELLSIERLLLARAAAKGPVLVLWDLSFTRYREEALGSTDIDSMAYGVFAGNSLLLNAPMSHWSAAGNRLRAEELFAYLAGKLTVELPALELAPLSLAATPNTRPLYELSDGILSVEGKPAGRLMVHKRGAPQPHFYEPLDLGERRVAALFLAGGRDPAFVTLPEPAGPNDEVVLSFKLDGELQEASLGRASAPLGIVAALVLDRHAFVEGRSLRTGAPWTIQVSETGLMGGVGIHAQGKVTNARVLLAGREILRAKRRPGVLKFEPSAGEIVVIRAEAGQDLDLLHIKKTGLFSVGKNVPFIGYRVVNFEPPPFERPLRAPLRVR